MNENELRRHLNQRIFNIGKEHMKGYNTRRKINNLAQKQREEEQKLLKEYANKQRAIRNRYQEMYHKEYKRLEAPNHTRTGIHATMEVLARQLRVPNLVSYIGTRRKQMNEIDKKRKLNAAHAEFRPGGPGHKRASNRFLAGAATMQPIPPIEPSPHRGAVLALLKMSRGPLFPNSNSNSESGKRRRF